MKNQFGGLSPDVEDAHLIFISFYLEAILFDIIVPEVSRLYCSQRQLDCALPLPCWFPRIILVPRIQEVIKIACRFVRQRVKLRVLALRKLLLEKDILYGNNRFRISKLIYCSRCLACNIVTTCSFIYVWHVTTTLRGETNNTIKFIGYRI